MKNISNINIEHYFRINNDWNKDYSQMNESNYDFIVLDNYPLKPHDIVNINKSFNYKNKLFIIKDKNVDIVKSLLDKNNCIYYSKNEINSFTNKINNFLNFSMPPNLSDLNIICNDDDVVISYSDGTTLLFNSDLLDLIIGNLK